MKVIIVESPTKARTLTRFLGDKEYRVEATMGHVRDLPKAALGVDVDHDFSPNYIIPRDKLKRVGELRKTAEKAETIILATDPDREGEAIAWHVAQTLRKSEVGSQKSDRKIRNANSEIRDPQLQRIVFHEITEQAIKEALAHPRDIDRTLVDSQQARRVLDRLVGYKLSPLLWQKLSKRWLSAGRVQSVAVRLIVEREREIEKFIKENYWTIDGHFFSRSEVGQTFSAHPSDPGTSLSAVLSKEDMTVLEKADLPDRTQIISQLVSKDDIKYEKTLTYDLFDGKYTTTSSAISDKQKAISIINDLKAPYSVSAVDKKEIRRTPPPPYTTSTLQQDAGRKLYFSAKKTMQLAQKLYEEGHITYHRTDSLNLSDTFVAAARHYLGQTYGDGYVPEKPRRYHTKSRVAQEAHEAIRPTKIDVHSETLKVQSELNKDHVRLYELIWKRALASQAADAIFNSTTIDISASNGYLFETQGSIVKFDGFLKITGREDGEVVLPAVAVGEHVDLHVATPQEHATNPPPRYSEATLVKTLDQRDIGRPSTYAPIITTIQERQYVTKVEKKLVPTDLGVAVTDFLVQYFPNIMELPFTAKMEESLDDIANGTAQWVPVIRAFYEPFAKDLDATYQNAAKVKVAEEMIDEKCPTCGNQLVIRLGRYGKFIACSTFPACTYTRQFAEKIDMKCPRCGGDIVVKKSRRGKVFYGCSNYPTCNFAAWKKEDIK